MLVMMADSIIQWEKENSKKKVGTKNLPGTISPMFSFVQRPILFWMKLLGFRRAEAEVS